MQSQVYKARWQGLLVAVKILNAEESAQQEEFKKEVAMLEALRHPHIVNYLGHLFQESGEGEGDASARAYYKGRARPQYRNTPRQWVHRFPCQVEAETTS